MSGVWVYHAAPWLVLFGVAVVLGALRVVGFKSPAYQAVAHLFVGFLIGGAVMTGGGLYAVLAVGLSVVEVAVFVAGKVKQ